MLRSESPSSVRVQVRRLDPELPLPLPAHADDAAVDLVARVDVELPPGGGRALVPTGLSIAVPVGFGGFVLPRSGLAARHGVTVLNGPGLVDPGYRGEIMVPLVNTDPAAAFAVRRGDRIAQLLVLPVPAITWDEVTELTDPRSTPAAQEGAAARGERGFGSSGR